MHLELRATRLKIPSGWNASGHLRLNGMTVLEIALRRWLIGLHYCENSRVSAFKEINGS